MGCFLNRGQYHLDMTLTIILKKIEAGEFTLKVQKRKKDINKYNRLRVEYCLK